MNGLGYIFLLATIASFIVLLVLAVRGLSMQSVYKFRIGAFQNKLYVFILNILIIGFSFFLVSPYTKPTEPVEEGKTEIFENKISVLNETKNEIKLTLKNKLEKQKKQELKKELKTVEKEIKTNTKELKKERRKLFFYKNRTSIFIVFVSIDLLIFIIYFIAYLRAYFEFKQYIELEAIKEKAKREAASKKIEKISEIIAENFTSLDEADKIVEVYNEYNSRKQELDKNIKSAHKNVKNINEEGWFLNFGRTERLEKAKKDESKLRKEKAKLEVENGTLLATAKSFFTQIGDEDGKFYKNHREEIAKRVKAILRKHEEELLELQKEQQRKLEQEKQNAISQLQSQRKQEEEKLEKSQKIESVTFTIKDMEQFIPVLQTHVSENKNLDFQLLTTLENYLDRIEDLIEFIPEDFKNNIERCQKKLNLLFEKCSNQDDIKADVEIIQESFLKLLNKEK